MCNSVVEHKLSMCKSWVQSLTPRRQKEQMNARREKEPLCSILEITGGDEQVSQRSGSHGGEEAHVKTTRKANQSGCVDYPLWVQILFQEQFACLLIGNVNKWAKLCLMSVEN